MVIVGWVLICAVVLGFYAGGVKTIGWRDTSALFGAVFGGSAVIVLGVWLIGQGAS